MRFIYRKSQIFWFYQGGSSLGRNIAYPDWGGRSSVSSSGKFQDCAPNCVAMISLTAPPIYYSSLQPTL